MQGAPVAKATTPPTKPTSFARSRLYGDFLEPLLYLGPGLLLLTIFVFYPTLRSIYLSMYLTDPLGRPKVFVGVQNFIDAVTNDIFLGSLGTTGLFVLFTVPVGIIIGILLAILANQKLRGIKIFQLIFSSPLCISVATGAMIFQMMYNPLSGMFNYFLSLFGVAPIHWLTDPKWALLSVGIVSIWMRLGFNFVLMLSGLQNVPPELYEAARVDGASPARQAWHITLPMLSPTIFFAAIVSVIHGMQVFGEVDILTSGGPAGATHMVVFAIYDKAFREYQFGAASAQALVVFAIILLLTFVQFKLGERKVHYQ